MARSVVSKLRRTSLSALVVLVCAASVVEADFAFGEPWNLGPRVNSSAVEGTPVLPADGLSLYFDSSRSGGSGDYDVWMARRDTTDSEWGTPISLPSPVNSSAWDGVPSISLDGLTLYLSSYRPGGSGGSDIWVTSRQTIEDAWPPPANLGPIVNSPSDEWTQSMSADGLELYFSSWRPGGLGDADLWITRRATTEDDWSTPVNLGPGVNSFADDINPSISSDGLCLFFFSLREGGYGGRDIWVTTRAARDQDWRKPVNVGSPVNTANADQGATFSPDGATLYFCSNRPGGYGSLDLMQIPLVPIVDFTGDGKVDGDDVMTMAEHWGQRESACDVGPTAFGDGIVDVRDLFVLAEYIGKDVDDPTLIGHWALDETEGDVARDSARENDGMVEGNPVWQPEGGVVNGALELNGMAGDIVVISDCVLNPGDGSFSVLAWIKGGEAGQTIISQKNGADWLVIDVSSGALSTRLQASRRGTPLVSQAVIADGQWHRIGLAWDGSTRSLYVDGALAAQDQQADLEECDGGLYIGGDHTDFIETSFTGLIDDVRIYSRAVRP